MILWFPLSAVATVGLLCLLANSFAATLILGVGVLLGRVLGIDMVDVLLQNLRRTQPYQPEPMTRAGRRLYNLLAWAAGGMLVAFGLTVGYAQGWW
jgi:hypothetical protein